MFNRKIVFVLGAGASCEIGLPSSETLKTKIAELVKMTFERYQLVAGDYKIYEALKLHLQRENQNGELTPFVHAGRKIDDAIHLVPSIDSFIDNHYGDFEIELCGKLGICRAILQAEENSLLNFDPRLADARMDFANVEPKWYGRFFKLLTANVRHDNLEDIFKNVTFIVFNYDRCLEHYLFNSLKSLFKINDAEAAALVNQIDIIHPFGTVGSLPWQELEEAIPFAGEVEASKLLNLSGQIKTFSEQVKENSIVAPIRKAIEESESVVFLGFAFHTQNLEILTPINKTHGKKVFATGLDFSKENCSALESTMRGVLKMERIGTETHFRSEFSCAKLFEDYYYVFRSL